MSIVSVLYLLNQVLDFDQLAQKHHWDMGKTGLDFGDLDLIFKVTTAL